MRPSISATANRRAAAALLLALSAAPAHALLRFDESRNQVYVTGYVGVGYDSNVFTNDQPGNGDMIISGGAGMEFARKAGLIGVNASLGWDFGNFATFTEENFLNPSMSLEFSKGTGRTTGAVQLNARRETRADPTVGLRTDSWNYGINLNYRYPIMERYSLAGNIGYAITDYVDPGQTFVDLDTYTVGTDLFYSWRSDRDLLAGYRYRFSETSVNSESVDHSWYVGVSGRILSKLSGSARVGWTYRENHFPGDTTLIDGVTPKTEDSSDGMYVSLSGTWPATRKATYTLALTQDFSSSSTNFQTQTSSADLTGQFSHTVKFSTRANLGVGYTQFLSGFAPDSPTYSEGFNGEDRNDHYFTCGVGANYTLTEHFTLSANYTFYQNWSNLSSYEFVRHSVGLTLSTRW
ncbi:MAG: outer membrane beta-barrel protein [Burkholderiales bacterium]|nr:outer membrane beta-barrel protein [Opitutaceae bacterium]